MAIPLMQRDKDTSLYSSHCQSIGEAIKEQWLAIEEEKKALLNAHHQRTKQELLRNRKT